MPSPWPRKGTDTSLDRVRPTPASPWPLQGRRGLTRSQQFQYTVPAFTWANSRCARLVQRIDACSQAVAGVVHALHGVRIATDFLDADDVAEALFTHQLHAVVHIDQNRGRKQVAGRGAAFAAGEQLRTFGQGVGHLSFQHRDLRRAGDGADIGVRAFGIAVLQAFDSW